MIVTKHIGKKILVIDDEKHIAEAIKLNLKMLGHEVVVAVNGLEGLNWWKEFSPDLVIVDLNKEAAVPQKPKYSMADFDLLAGWKLKGWPVLTMLRGQIIMENGSVVGKPSFGRYVPARVK